MTFPDPSSAEHPDDAIAGRTTLTPADGRVLVRASRSRIAFFNQARLLLYCAVAAALAAVVSLDGHRRSASLLLIVAAVLFVAALVAGSRAQTMISRGYARGQEREMVVRDAGIEIAEPGLRTAYAWQRFERALEGPEHVILFGGPSVVVLPKRAFASGDVARLRELLRQRLPVDPFA